MKALYVVFTLCFSLTSVAYAEEKPSKPKYERTSEYCVTLDKSAGFKMCETANFLCIGFGSYSNCLAKPAPAQPAASPTPAAVVIPAGKK